MTIEWNRICSFALFKRSSNGKIFSYASIYFSDDEQRLGTSKELLRFFRLLKYTPTFIASAAKSTHGSADAYLAERILKWEALYAVCPLNASWQNKIVTAMAKYDMIHMHFENMVVELADMGVDVDAWSFFEMHMHNKFTKGDWMPPTLAIELDDTFLTKLGSKALYFGSDLPQEEQQLYIGKTKPLVKDFVRAESFFLVKRLWMKVRRCVEARKIVFWWYETVYSREMGPGGALRAKDLADYEKEPTAKRARLA